jgi:hypothetical protein
MMDDDASPSAARFDRTLAAMALFFESFFRDLGQTQTHNGAPSSASLVRWG